jgi:hypothetical protein
MIYLWLNINIIMTKKQKLKVSYENSFLETVFEKLSNKSKSIKNKSLFTDQVFHLFTDKIEEQKQMIFKSNNDLLVITQNGNTLKGKWSYLPEYLGIIIEFKEEITTYKHSFLNDIIFALKRANSNDISIYVNEVRFRKEMKKKLSKENLSKYLENLNNDSNTKDSNTDSENEDLNVAFFILVVFFMMMIITYILI